LVTTLYVGNLPWATTEAELQRAFAPYADVKRVRVITDRETGRSRGFGFVEVADEDAARAIEALNGTTLGGRPLTVNAAQARAH
jgi:RNA recognition motif-containing protein